MPSVIAPPSCYLDTAEVIARVFAHLDAGSTDLGPRTGRVPVAHYLDPDRLSAELALLRRLPVPFCPSAALAEPGSFLARDAAGVPIVVVRDSGGTVRAYRNACRHRGTALVEGSGCARSFVCPFHGWVYALDGSLSHVPDAYGFDGVKLRDRGLVPVGAIEHAGLVFVAQDAAADLSAVTVLPGLMGNQVLVEEERIPVAANWKVLTEGFLEGYHLRQTHKSTFLPFGYDNLTVVEHAGRNSRVNFPFRRVEALREIPRERWRAEGALTVVDHLFPNAIIARLTAHTAVVIVEPVTATNSVLVVYKVAPTQLGDVVAESVHRDIAFVETGLVEDRAMAEGVQRGLAARTGEVVFGRFESALTHLHEGLAAELGGSLSTRANVTAARLTGPTKEAS